MEVILVQAVLDKVVRPIDVFAVELIWAQMSLQAIKRRRDLTCPYGTPPEFAPDPRIVSIALHRCVLVVFAGVETLVTVRVSVAEA
eukprot:1359311-Amorphochlora_amoeboformis.AAC.2